MPSPLRIQREQRDELTCWRLTTADAELLIAEQGAQVLSHGRPGEPPLIWLSEQAAFRGGQSVRGGVPLCWPWFGDLKRNPQAIQAQHAHPAEAPFHGLARTLPWVLQDIAHDGEAARLVFALPLPEGGLPDWPHALVPQLEIRLDQALSLLLRSHNRGTKPLWLSQALHSYLAVSDIHAVDIPALDGGRYVDTLDDWRECRQQGALRFTGETDRIHLDTPSLIRLRDPGWSRQLCLEAIGSTSAIVWNPWIDKGARLSQFADDAWQRMLCIETANVLDDCREIAPGADTVMGLRLWREPLEA